ncbi:MAG: PLP-dependent transferase [Clostridioides difficile]
MQYITNSWGQEPDSATGSRAVPIYQTTSYCFDSVQYGADCIKEEGHIYSRISNKQFKFLKIECIIRRWSRCSSIFFRNGCYKCNYMYNESRMKYKD